ncbi:MAG: hypothetical protein SGI92_08755 [Bryobacteraceae bacterium]|nr:hypothetical protein [Bryobacteraceae bacterium]
MKTILKIATVAALAAASAFAQGDLKARIPFAFATPGGGEMPAGQYEIARTNATSAMPVYRILNVDTKQSVMAMAADTVRRPAADRNAGPAVTFRCAAENCAISGVFTGTSDYGSGIRAKLKNVDPKVMIAEIAIPFGE